MATYRTRDYSLRAPALYVMALRGGTGPRLLLAAIVEATLRGRVFQPSLDGLARLAHRSPRTVTRWSTDLRKLGYVRVVMRGRKRTNVYRLTLRFWRRVTGRRPSKLPDEVQETLWRLGLKIGLDDATMRRHGITRTGRR